MDFKSVDDLSILSRESIINEYNALYECYKEQKLSEHRQLQEIHQLRRELQTALNDKNHLSSELEIIYSEHAKEIEVLQEKHSEDLHEYKDRVLAYKSDLETLESARDNLEVMVDGLRKESEEEKQINSANVPVDNNQSLYADKISLLEVENDELAEAVEHLKAELTEALKMNLQCDSKIEDLTDRLRCAEENLNTKRDELEEKNEMYETAQERVIELSGELNALRSESDTASKRGNSLFAEVDDQRQKMKALLTAQKANYIEMKNELEKSQQEMRKLKRENTAMYKEMEVCSHIFLNAEQHHTEKLNERIAELMKENEAISKKLTFTEDCLQDMIQKNDVKWLDPMISICKIETNDLKDKLYRCSLQKVTIAGNLRQCEEESARWRFEALKSRCIIADRESLLEDHKIPFGAISDIDRRIRRIDNENISPNIACRPSMLGFKRRSLNKLQAPQNNSTDVSGNGASETVVIKVEPSSSPTEAVHLNHVTDKIKVENTSKPDAEPIQDVVTTKFAKPNPIEIIAEKPVEQSTSFAGVTIRKKMNTSSNNASLLGTPSKFVHYSKSPGTCLPSKIRPKINFQTNSTGILKPSSIPNIQPDRKVKFADGSSVANKNMENPSSERKVKKLDDVPKTAIKKRIFISSKKPSKPIV